MGSLTRTRPLNGIFSPQPGTKECPTQTRKPKPEWLITDKVRPQPIPTVNADLLSHLVLNFKAGCIKDHIANWKSVTTDPVILDVVKHYHKEFEGGRWPVQATKPKQITFAPGDKVNINAEITKLLDKGVIDFISTIFVRPKKNGSHWLILNLKPLNEFVTYYHVKCHCQRKPGRNKSSRSAFDLHLFSIEKVPEKIIKGGIVRSWWVFYFKIKSFI